MIILPILKYLFPDGVNRVDWVVRNDSYGNGDYIWQWNRPEPQPTEAELAAAEPEAMLAHGKASRKATATLHGLQYANTTADPLTGAPISTATDASTIRQNTWSAEQYWKVADGMTQAEIDAQWPNANAHAHADITTVRALQDTLRGVTLAIHAEIDAITDEANLPTESEIINDIRWP